MNKNIRHIISTGLLVIFLTPILSKGIDFVFHNHHQNIVCTTKTEKHFHSHKEDCYIASFTFSVFITFIKDKIPIIKLVYFTEKKDALISIFLKYIFHFYLLRAPPVL